MRHISWKTTPTKLRMALLSIGLTLVALAAVCATPSPPTLTVGLSSPPPPPAASADIVQQVAMILDVVVTPTPPLCPPGAPAGCQTADQRGCLACHTTDGTALIGPTWKGLFGRTEELEGGGTVTVDDAYLQESIKDPGAKVVKGFTTILMPPLTLSEDDVKAIIDYIKTLE